MSPLSLIQMTVYYIQSKTFTEAQPSHQWNYFSLKEVSQQEKLCIVALWGKKGLEKKEGKGKKTLKKQQQKVFFKKKEKELSSFWINSHFLNCFVSLKASYNYSTRMLAVVRALHKS